MDQEDNLRNTLFTFLSRHNVMTLAYHDEQGPGACAVWFVVTRNLTCYFLSSEATRHGTALKHGGDIAFTVHKDEQNWRTIQGVQGIGFCVPVSNEQRELAWQAYSARFPFVLQQFPSISVALVGMTLWCVTPRWIRLIDNTRGFGHKVELKS